MPRPEGRRFLVMAIQPTMPKAVSSLQSVQMSYILDNEESKHSERKRRKGTEKFKEFSAEELVDGQ
jgi:hypothetical protein